MKRRGEGFVRTGNGSIPPFVENQTPAVPIIKMGENVISSKRDTKNELLFFGMLALPRILRDLKGRG